MTPESSFLRKQESPENTKEIPDQVRDEGKWLHYRCFEFKLLIENRLRGGDIAPDPEEANPATQQAKQAPT